MLKTLEVLTHTHQHSTCTCTFLHVYSNPLIVFISLPILQPYELLNLADALERKYFTDGSCIIKQGDSADAFYIVEDGTVKITKDDPVSDGLSLADSAVL